MADKKISQLDSASSVSSGAYFPISQSGTTYKGTTDQIGEQIATNQDFSGLNTTSKKVIGAINEVLANSDKDIISSIDTPSPIMTFNDGGDNIPVNKLLVAVTAQQASGTPTPSSPLPITGWNSASVCRTTKNLFVPDFTNIGKNWNGSANTSRCYMLIPFPKGDYTLSLSDASTAMQTLSQLDLGRSKEAFPLSNISSTSLVDRLAITSASTSFYKQITIDDDWKYLFVGFSIASGTITEAIINAIKVQVEVGLLTPSQITYEKSNGIRITIPFGDTYYGCILDVANGKLTVTHKIWQASGATAYGSVGTSYYAYDANNKPDGMTQQDFLEIISDKYQCATSIDDRLNGYCYTTSSGNIVFIDDRFTSLANAQSILSSEAPKIVYPLATPVIINLTPEQITTLAGLNNIYADCGDIQELEYFNGNADDVAELNRAMSDDFHIYSTSEQIVGKWLGEDLYEKSYHYTQATVPAQGVAVVIDDAIANLNLASLVDMTCVYKTHHTSQNYDVWYHGGLSNTQLDYSTGKLLFYQKATSQQQNYNNLEVNITIRYTKAS